MAWFFQYALHNIVYLWTMQCCLLPAIILPLLYLIGNSLYDALRFFYLLLTWASPLPVQSFCIMKILNLNNTFFWDTLISKYQLNFILVLTLSILLPLPGISQSLFTENFDEAANSTSGTSVEGIAWSTSCPTCIDTGDWFKMVAGDLEAEDTNGPATMTFTIPAASIGAFGNFDITVNFTGSGNIYESTGANFIDSVSVSYAFSGSGSGLVGTLIGNDINIGLIEGLNIAVGTGDLTITVTAQNWAADEDINFTGISLVGQSPLPIELKYFTGKLEDNKKVVLQWSTASELNNEFFIVQRSSDGRNFKDMERVSGQGTTYTDQYYSIIDNKPLAGAN
ncbi:MAG TPA: hypothetical protein ENJ95_08200, partial [Bacteroidetes bacterium]|nr:hypothetical protein [Bacteroidota bacterium]